LEEYSNEKNGRFAAINQRLIKMNQKVT